MTFFLFAFIHLLVCDALESFYFWYFDKREKLSLDLFFSLLLCLFFLVVVVVAVSLL